MIATPSVSLLSSTCPAGYSGGDVAGSLQDFGMREGGLWGAEAKGALGLLALFNALGRIAWGSVSQTVG